MLDSAHSVTKADYGEAIEERLQQYKQAFGEPEKFDPTPGDPRLLDCFRLVTVLQTSVCMFVIYVKYIKYDMHIYWVCMYTCQYIVQYSRKC